MSEKHPAAEALVLLCEASYDGKDQELFRGLFASTASLPVRALSMMLLAKWEETNGPLATHDLGAVGAFDYRTQIASRFLYQAEKLVDDADNADNAC